jgi:Flp pilus assembly protein TadD
MDLPPGPPPDPPAEGGPLDGLQLTLRYGEHPIATRVHIRDGELVPDAPFDISAQRVPGGWEVTGPEGTTRLGDGDRLRLQQGAMEVELAPVPQTRFARFHWEQGDVMLPVIMLATTVLVLQLALFWRLTIKEQGGAAGAEPSPEYIARLLDQQFDGSPQGVLAHSAPRPTTGEAIENFYLQPGHDGPRDHLGGGKNIGRKIHDGDANGHEASRPAAPAPGPGGDQAPVDSPDVADADGDATADPLDDPSDEDRPIAVHVDKGWGLTDWYDTKDAREDADEIQRELQKAHELLKLDPNDPYGLSIRAYYEYLAMDFNAARRTYDKYTRLYPEEPGGWNNLALVYKRQGDYVKEEELYRIALGLEPENDHALLNLALCLAHQERFDEALTIMDRLEQMQPDDPYADLHRAKIYAAMGKEDRAYHFLQKSLAGMRKLDTLHNIEFRQDIRVDPSLATLRGEERFGNLLNRYYGEKADHWWKRKGSP